MWDTLYNTDSENSGLISPDHDHVALLLGGVMSFHGGSRAEAAQIVQDHLTRLRPGAFLAMTHHRLGDEEKAQAVLLRLRKAMQQPLWIHNAEARAFLREAEELLGGTDDAAKTKGK